MTDAEKLSPCAHCGSLARIIYNCNFHEYAHKLYKAICINCGLQLPWNQDINKIIEKWNQRA